MRRSVLVGLSAVLAIVAAPFAITPRAGKLGGALRDAPAASGPVRVIVQTEDPDAVESLVTVLGGRTGRRLPSVPGLVAELPASRLRRLASSPVVRAVNIDRTIRGTLERTVAAIGARWVRENLGL